MKRIIMILTLLMLVGCERNLSTEHKNIITDKDVHNQGDPEFCGRYGCTKQTSPTYCTYEYFDTIYKQEYFVDSENCKLEVGDVFQLKLEQK